MFRFGHWFASLAEVEIQKWLAVLDCETDLLQINI